MVVRRRFAFGFGTSLDDGRLVFPKDCRGRSIGVFVEEFGSSSETKLARNLDKEADGYDLPSFFLIVHLFGPPLSWQLAHAPLKKPLELPVSNYSI